MPAGDRLIDGSGRGPEARIPRSWMESPRVLALSDPAFRVWVALWSFADGQTGENAFPTVGTLGRVTGRHRRSVFRAIAELHSVTGCRCGEGCRCAPVWSGPLLTKQRRHGADGHRRSNLLTLVNPLTITKL